LKKLIELGVLGVGLVGKRHVEFIMQNKRAKLVAIADPDDSVGDFANKIGVTRYKSLSDMLASTNLDGVIIATPNNMHLDNGLECINKNIPCLIEKPLATSTTQALKLNEASNKHNVPILVGHHRRYNPIIQSARKLIESGTLGNIRSFHANCWLYKPEEYYEESVWRTQKGAGPVSVNLVHDIDLIRYFCGDVISIQAQTVKSKRGHQNEDVAAAILRFKNDAIATINVSDTIVAPWSWELTSNENPAYPATSENCYIVGGEHGSLSLPDLRIWKNDTKRGWWEPISSTNLPHSSSDPLANQINHFISVINSTEMPLVTAEEGLKNLEVIEGIYESAESGKIVKIT